MGLDVIKSMERQGKKAPEDYQIIGTDRIHFDDKETVINIIK